MTSVWLLDAVWIIQMQVIQVSSVGCIPKRSFSRLLSLMFADRLIIYWLSFEAGIFFYFMNQKSEQKKPIFDKHRRHYSSFFFYYPKTPRRHLRHQL